MTIINYKNFQLAIFEVDGGLHITVVPERPTPKHVVLNNIDLRNKLHNAFLERYKRNGALSLNQITNPHDNSEKIFIAILK